MKDPIRSDIVFNALSDKFNQTQEWLERQLSWYILGEYVETKVEDRQNIRISLKLMELIYNEQIHLFGNFFIRNFDMKKYKKRVIKAMVRRR